MWCWVPVGSRVWEAEPAVSAHLLVFVHDHVWAPPSPRCAPFQPPWGTASATLVLVCPRPANPTDGVAVLGPLMGDVPMGSGQETEEALLYQHFFPRWFLASGAEVLCTYHVPIHPCCHLAATT